MTAPQLIIMPQMFWEDNLAGCLINDIREVFSSTVGSMDLSPLAEQVSSVICPKGGLIAMVGIAGRYNGVVGLYTPCDLALEFTSEMLGMEVAEMGDDVHDAMGEIANMIAGTFKQHLSPDGSDVRLSTPSVLDGEDYCLSIGKPGVPWTLSCATSHGRVTVSAMLEKTN